MSRNQPLISTQKKDCTVLVSLVLMVIMFNSLFIVFYSTKNNLGTIKINNKDANSLPGISLNLQENKDTQKTNLTSSSQGTYTNKNPSVKNSDSTDKKIILGDSSEEPTNLLDDSGIRKKLASPEGGENVIVYKSEKEWKENSADFNLDKKVDFSDFFLFSDNFRTTNSRYDLNKDGTVGFDDFFLFADSFGKNIEIIPPQLISTEANLQASSKEGIAPLEIEVELSGIFDEKTKIVNYSIIFLGETITSTTPINKKIIFDKPGEFYILGKVTDSQGNEANQIIHVSVKPAIIPRITQAATLQNKVDIHYRATLENIETTTLEILKNGNPFETKKITNDYSETFNNLPKGEYSFTALEKTTFVTIPDYAPTIDLFEINSEDLKFNEEESVVINLNGKISDANPEDNVILKAESRDGKTEISITDYIIKIIGKSDSTGDYSIRIYAGEGEAQTTKNIQGYIYQIVHLSGKIINSETRKNTQGTFWVYDDDWNLLQTDISNPDLSNPTNTNREFNLKIKKRASDIQNLIIQGGIGTPEETIYNGEERTKLSESYVRTVKDIKSGEDVLITAVPYGKYEDEPEDFLAYFLEQSYGLPKVFDFTGDIVKSVKPDSDYDGLKKIIILKNDPFGDEYFTQEQYEYFKQRILDTNDINSLTPRGNFITEDMIFFSDDFEGVDYTLEFRYGEDQVISKPGVIVVVPSDAGTDAYPKNFGATVNGGGTIRIHPTSSSGRIGSKALSHEFGHIFMGPGHPETLHTDTVMSYLGGSSQTIGPADKKQAKILNTKDYVVFPEYDWPRIDHIGNILGLYVGSEDYIVVANEKDSSWEEIMNARGTDDTF